MIHLALLILAVYIIARAGVALFGLTIAACAGISDWLDGRPGRRRRFWWTVAVILATPVLLIWYAISPAGLGAAVIWAAVITLVVFVWQRFERL